MPKLKKRADGRYCGKLLVGTIDGKPKYRYVYGSSPKEVNDKLSVLRVELGKGADLTQPTSLAFWIDRWLARTEQTQTPEWHALCVTRAEFWKRECGDMEITKITTADLEDVLLALARENPETGRPTAKKTLTEYASVIRRVFALAAQNRVITFDPSNYITVEKNAPRAKRTAISEAQIAAIHETQHECRLPCLIMLYTGLRLGELVALTWSDVDLDERQITVTKSYNFKTSEIKTPKTAAGVRTVPIPEILFPELQAAAHSSLMVCPRPTGGVYTRRAWEDALNRYCKTLGFQIRAHELRHTYATILYEAGVDVLTAQHLLGHADSATTMGIYTHLRDAKKAASIAKLDAYLSPSGSQSGVR